MTDDSDDSTAQAGAGDAYYNNAVYVQMENTAPNSAGLTIQAIVYDSYIISDVETTPVIGQDTGNNVYGSGVLNTDAGTIYFEAFTRPPDYPVGLDDAAKAIGWSDQGEETGGYDPQAHVFLASAPNNADHHMLVTLTGFDGGGAEVSAKLLHNQDLLDLSATEPYWHEVLAEGVQNNYERTGTWYIAPTPDDAPGSGKPTDWDALAAEAQARFDATGQWGLLSYDAADSEWGIL